MFFFAFVACNCRFMLLLCNTHYILILQMVVKTKKVFIGGLSANSTLEDMKAYFEQYGKVRERERKKNHSHPREKGRSIPQSPSFSLFRSRRH